MAPRRSLRLPWSALILELLSRAVRHEWLVRAATPVFGLWNPFLASYRRDPYPAYRRLRERAPRYRHRLFQSWLFTRYDDVVEVLGHPEMSVARAESDLFKKYLPFAGADERLESTLYRSLLMLDPPDHTRKRSMVLRGPTRLPVTAGASTYLT